VVVGTGGGFDPAAELSWTVDPTDCAGQNGAIQLTSAIPYLYALDSIGNWQADSEFDALSMGAHDLYIASPDTSCQTVLPISINVPRPAQPRVDSIAVAPLSTCGAMDGVIQLFPGSGAGTQEYALAAVTDFQLATDFSALASGSYVVIARHLDSGCSRTIDTVSVDIASPLRIEIDTVLTPTCYGVADGMVLLSAVGGDGQYTFAWSDGRSGADIAGLAAGVYILTVTDGGACRDSLAIDIPERADFAAIATTVGDTLNCSPTALHYDFSSYPALNFSWSGPAGWQAAGPNVWLPESGAYTVRVSAPDGCTYEENFEVAFGSASYQADFLLPVEGLVDETVVAIDISWPIPEAIEWIFDPNQAEDLGQYENQQRLRFAAPGRYEVGLRSHFGECAVEVYRQIRILSDADSLQTPPIAGATGEILGLGINPNPNYGIFTATLQLWERAEATFYIFAVNGEFVLERRVDSADLYVESFDIQQWPAGTYTLIARTASAYAYLNFVKL
jgi:hypothetical protein